MSRQYLVIGNGNAGATAAEKLREEDGDADITVVTDDSEALYNRIMLKNYMKGTLPLQYSRVHDRKWYEKRGIELHLETRIEEVDLEDQVAVSSSGESFSYDSLLVATGGSPREHPEDEGYENVHYMWTMADAEEVRADAESARKAVVIGGGLLGIDLALAYAENGAETYYLVRADNWWHRGLDDPGAEIIHRKLEEKGVNVFTGTEVRELVSRNGEVVKVTADDREFECDTVAVAIGQEPNSDFIDVEKNDRGMIKTDETLETSEKGVYAAGNMVEYYSPVFEKRVEKGSWDHSEAMGETAARNMMDADLSGDNRGGADQEFRYVNTYGVGHFDVQFLAIGDWDAEAVQKKYSEDEYRRLFFDGKRLVGAVMIGYTKGQEQIRNWIKEKREFSDRERLLEKSFWE
ncbi:MAG: NAD(P)/FAD-dependent oxidoreductase [Candidatus Nanohaloarchaea archaeon]